MGARTLLLPNLLGMMGFFYISSSFAEVRLEASDNVPAGAEIAVRYQGEADPKSFLTIVKQGAREHSYGDYQYLNTPSPIKLSAPAEPGDYEIRLLAADSPYPTLTRRSLTVAAAEASLEAPASVAAGKALQIKWTGPGNDKDYLTIAKAGTPDRSYITYQYARDGKSLDFVAPDLAGDYELRYLLGNGDKVIARQPLKVTSVSATINAPAQVAAGSTVTVQWTGPNNPRDFITLVPANAQEGAFHSYEYTAKGNPVTLKVPDQPGNYELRYATGESYLTLGKSTLVVTPNSASLDAPKTAVAGSNLTIGWTGPDNPQDYITIVPQGTKQDSWGNYVYTHTGNPVTLLAPIAAGNYELRYATGQSSLTLASVPITLTPAQAKPGSLDVSAGNAARQVSQDKAVEVILDASGSMLQQLNGIRRIDIAKQTLLKLTGEAIPADSLFALRVFGREVDSCQTDLDIALAPLKPDAVKARISNITAKNNAKTPIGASLAAVSGDLAKASGEKLVILITDGEETCGGDPLAAIQQLRAAGTNVRINIVGFAIDDDSLKTTFTHWARAGAGAYFDAKDAAGLNTALTQAIKPAFEILSADGKVVADGVIGDAAIALLPGKYTVRIKGKNAQAQEVMIESETVTRVSL